MDVQRILLFLEELRQRIALKKKKAKKRTNVWIDKYLDTLMDAKTISPHIICWEKRIIDVYGINAEIQY